MKPCVWSVRCLVAGFALTGANAAWSQAGPYSPYSLSAYGTVSYQPNVFQAANGDQRTSDVITSAGVNFGFKQTFDNINAFVNGNVQSNTYKNTPDLNGASYNLNLGLGSSGERLGTVLRYSTTQGLGNYGTPNVAQTTDQNIQNTQEAGLALRYKMTPRTNLVGGIGYQSVTFSATAFEAQENSSSVAFVDVVHQLNPALKAGVGLRYSSGRTPHYQLGPTPGSFVEDEFDGKYLDLLAQWKPGSSNTMNARLSLSRVTHSQATQLDFSGLTGFVNWTYTASSKLAFTASLTQNTGTGPAVFGVVPLASSSSSDGGSTTGTPPTSSTTPSTGPSAGTAAGAGAAGGTGTGGSPAPGGTAVPANTTNTVDANRLNTGISLAASYQASRTIAVNGSLAFNNADLANSAGATGRAWTTALGLGIAYAPTHSILVSCNVNVTVQNANQSAESSGQAYSYRSPVTSCTGQFSFL